jgi:hypothetical protein
MSPPDDLYDRDFFLWTQAQADALRAAGKGQRGSNSVEWERVAEEVEDLGKSDLHAAESLTARILIHLYKLAWTQNAQPKGHWEGEVIALRGNLKRKLTPTIRKAVEAELEALHEEAGEAAARAFKSDEPATPVNAALRWTLAEALGEENDPIA